MTNVTLFELLCLFFQSFQGPGVYDGRCSE